MRKPVMILTPDKPPMLTNTDADQLHFAVQEESLPRSAILGTFTVKTKDVVCLPGGRFCIDDEGTPVKLTMQLDAMTLMLFDSVAVDQPGWAETAWLEQWGDEPLLCWLSTPNAPVGFVVTLAELKTVQFERSER